MERLSLTGCRIHHETGIGVGEADPVIFASEPPTFEIVIVAGGGGLPPTTVEAEMLRELKVSAAGVTPFSVICCVPGSRCRSGSASRSPERNLRGEKTMPMPQESPGEIRTLGQVSLAMMKSVSPLRLTLRMLRLAWPVSTDCDVLNGGRAAEFVLKPSPFGPVPRTVPFEPFTVTAGLGGLPIPVNEIIRLPGLEFAVKLALILPVRV